MPMSVMPQSVWRAVRRRQWIKTLGLSAAINSVAAAGADVAADVVAVVEVAEAKAAVAGKMAIRNVMRLLAKEVATMLRPRRANLRMTTADHRLNRHVPSRILNRVKHLPAKAVARTWSGRRRRREISPWAGIEARTSNRAGAVRLLGEHLPLTHGRGGLPRPCGAGGT